MTTEFVIKFFGVLAGVVARSLLPWLRKLRDGEIQTFDRRYLLSAMASFILCLIITLLIFPQFSPANPSPDPSAGSPLEAYFKLFCLAFGFGFGFDGLVKEAGQWLRLYRRSKSGPSRASFEDFVDIDKE